MNKLVGAICLSIFAASTTVSVNAAIAGFESGLDPSFTYSGVTTRTGNYVAGSGYNLMVAHTGTQGHAFNPFAASPSVFSWAGAGTFNLVSFLIDGAWGSQTLTIDGLLGGSVQHTVQLAIDNSSVTTFTPSWNGIDAFRITTGDDFVNLVFPGSNPDDKHWVMDNLTYNTNAVPEINGSQLGIALTLLLSLVLLYREREGFQA